MKIYTNQEQANFEVECGHAEDLKAHMHRVRENHKSGEMLSHIALGIMVAFQLLLATSIIIHYLG